MTKTDRKNSVFIGFHKSKSDTVMFYVRLHMFMQIDTKTAQSIWYMVYLKKRKKKRLWTNS